MFEKTRITGRPVGLLLHISVQRGVSAQKLVRWSGRPVPRSPSPDPSPRTIQSRLEKGKSCQTGAD